MDDGHCRSAQVSVVRYCYCRLGESRSCPPWLEEPWLEELRAHDEVGAEAVLPPECLARAIHLPETLE